MLSCPNMRKVALRIVNDTLMVVRLRCKSWSCPVCSQINSSAFIRVVGRHFDRFPCVVFVTLTAKAGSGQSSYQELHRALPRVRRFVVQRYGKYSYANIWELHANGRFHIHGIWGWASEPDYAPIRGGFSRRLRRDLKDFHALLGLGHQIDVKMAEKGLVARYMVKERYVSKSVVQTRLALPRKAMLYMTSNDVPPIVTADRRNDRWTVHDPLDVNMLAIMPIYSVLDRRYLTIDDFDSGFWPA